MLNHGDSYEEDLNIGIWKTTLKIFEFVSQYSGASVVELVSQSDSPSDFAVELDIGEFQNFERFRCKRYASLLSS